MKINSLVNKKIAILGFGVTGQEVYKCLSQNHDITIVNDKPVAGFEVLNVDQVRASSLQFDVVIKSPGVPYSHPFLENNSAQITNDIELSYEFIKESNLSTKIVSITGTNGKTTTTQFIADVLNANGSNAYTCGNIGQSPLLILDEHDSIDYLVMELSSYQLKQVSKFTPDYGLFLNISPDHIDYHGDFEDYLNSKCNLFANMNESQPIVLDQGMVLAYPNIEWPKHALFGASDKQLAEIDTVSMPRQNYKLIYVLLQSLNIDDSLIVHMINNFQGLEHRLELVENNLGFKVINDSKATNVEATNVAISNLTLPTTLVVGGSIKVEDYTKLDYLNPHIKTIIAYGEARSKFEFIPNVIMIEDFTCAIEKAIEITNDNQILLLSPACASFDQHQSYVMRGNQFKQLIKGKNE